MNKLDELIPRKRQFAAGLDLKSVDAPMLSKFIKGRCNPTVDQAQAICKALGKDVFDVWDAPDLDYASISNKRPVKHARRCRDNSYPKFTIRVPPAIATAVNEQRRRLRLTQAEWIAYAATLISMDMEKKNAPAGVTTTNRGAEKKSTLKKYTTGEDLSNV